VDIITVKAGGIALCRQESKFEYYFAIACRQYQLESRLKKLTTGVKAAEK